MGDYKSGRKFYYRLSDPLYHFPYITSDFVIIHEITNGPFNRRDSIFAPLAPDEEDKESIKKFFKKISKDINIFFERRGNEEKT